MPPVDKSSGYWNSPEALIVFSAAANSSAVHGWSIVGIRIPFFSSTDFRANIASDTSK